MLRIYAVFVGLFAGAALTAFVLSYPWPVLAAFAALTITALLTTFPLLWLAALPALWPLIDLAPRTGQIFLTEGFALSAAALLALSLQQLRRPQPDPQRTFLLGIGRWLTLIVLTVSYALATQWSALPLLWSSFETPVDYHSPVNSLRVSSGFFLPLLLLPFLAQRWRAQPKDAARWLGAGVLLGLIGVSLAALWERWLFPGFSNFSSDYRTTALFWEANVGGAMLDGWLALTVPGMLYAALRARQRWQLLLAGAALLLVAYVVFTTFSRGLYLGVVVGVALTLVLYWRQTRAQGHAALPRYSVLLLSGLALLSLCFLAPWVFSHGGYRGLAALLGLASLLYAVAPVAATLSWRAWLAAAALALLAFLPSVLSLVWLPKGIYLLYAFGFAASLLLLLREFPRLRRIQAALALAVVLWTALNAALVTLYWSEGSGGLAGLASAAWVWLLLFTLRLVPRACWRPTLPGALRVGLVLSALVAGVLVTGTYYASARFATVEKDLDGRERHWSLGASLPATAAERWLGVGTGQYAPRYFFAVPDNTIPGSHRILREDGRSLLRLGGPRHTLGFGELYRVSQVLPADVAGPYTGQVTVRAVEGARLHLEICRKHLLYSAGCTTGRVVIPAGTDWQTLPLALGEGRVGAAGFPPLPVKFAMAAGTRGAAIDVAEITVIDAAGRELLRNGNFSRGSQHWFFSSDRHHLPWHAKNLWLHYYVEQGWLGMFAFSALLLLALGRLSLGAAASHALAPALAGGLLAFAVVGLFDSLVDAPRVAAIYYLLLFTALGLRVTRPRPPQRA